MTAALLAVSLAAALLTQRLHGWQLAFGIVCSFTVGAIVTWACAGGRRR